MRFPISIISAAAMLFATVSAAEIDIPYEKFQLDNGLTVIVHEDRKAPLVAVSVWYGVGSKNEPSGKSGFAHLFEHLMFQGSENYRDEFFKPFEEVGATDQNGTTSFDRTNYFQTVPTTALDMALWMESDRMGHFLGAVTQEVLDEQRDVVKNEKRQGENQPYGRVFTRLFDSVFPEGHPYGHTPIGSMEDLSAASLEDVKSWFKEYYGAANAVLVLAGDIDAEDARPLVEKYFADIESGPPLTEWEGWIPDRSANTSETMYDRVPQARVYRVWTAPGLTEQVSTDLNVAAYILGDGKNSRLYKDLVYDKQIATDVSVFNYQLELTSLFGVIASVKPGESMEAVNAAIDAQIEEYLTKGPTKAEVEIVSTKVSAEIIRGLEKVGGFGGKAVTLAQGELFADDPSFFFKKQLNWIKAATPKSVLAASREWLSDGYHQMNVLPFEDYKSVDTALDRSAGLPAVETTPDLTWPDIEEATLSNGMKVAFARRSAVPVVEVALQFDAGYAADAGGKLGAASFASSMLDEGTSKRSALEIAAEKERLGAEIGAGSNLDTTTVKLSALKDNLAPSLELFADIIRNPAFEQTEIDRLRPRWIAAIAQEKASPVSLALRLLPGEIYGEGHAYGVPFTGSGTEASIDSLTRDDLVTFHQSWMRPDNGIIFVVGATSLDEITPLLEDAFGDWRAPSTQKPSKNIAAVEAPAKGKVIIVDKPGSPQSLILAGVVAPPSGAENNIAITAMNDVLGGQFTARVNMNLREEKSWAYGAYTFLQDARGQRPWLVYAPVQTDKTRESIAELLKEFAEFRTSRPPTQNELTKVVLNNTRSLPGAYETSGDVLGSLLSSARFERDFAYPATLKDRFTSLDLSELQAATSEVVNADGLVWIVVGDREKIEGGIRSLDIGEVEVRALSDL